jgi:hypothetical protein
MPSPGSLVNTDEYVIYNRLPEWGYDHKTVCHAAGEYAGDEEWGPFLRSPCQYPRKVFGHFYAPGFGHMEESLRRIYRAT